MPASGSRYPFFNEDETTFELPRPRKIALGAVWHAVGAFLGRPDPDSALDEGFEFVYRPAASGLLRPTAKYTVRAMERPDGTTRITVKKQGVASTSPGGFGMPLSGLHAAALRELRRAAPAHSIFLSYRRHDSADITGRILDRLRDRFGSDAAFRDVDDVGIGVDFRRRVDTALTTAKLVLAVIGPRWAGAPALRLDDPDDMVRVEIEVALARGVPIVPVLVSGASMPGGKTLPGPLRRLPDLNAIPVRPDPDFDRDIERLTATLGPLLKDRE